MSGFINRWSRGCRPVLLGGLLAGLLLLSLIPPVPADAYNVEVLVFPNSSSCWEAGSTQDITWHPLPARGSRKGLNFIKLEYSSDNDATWNLIANYLDPSTGKYSWTVPAGASRARIRLTFLQYPYLVDEVGTYGTKFSGLPYKPTEDLEYSPIFEISMPINCLASPTDLTANAVPGEQINLAWKDNAGGETAYSIERRTGGGGYAEIASVPADTTTYSDQGLSPGTTYTYRVRARAVGSDTIKDSIYSREVCATIDTDIAVLDWVKLIDDIHKIHDDTP